MLLQTSRRKQTEIYDDQSPIESLNLANRQNICCLQLLVNDCSDQQAVDLLTTELSE